MATVLRHLPVRFSSLLLPYISARRQSRTTRKVSFPLDATLTGFLSTGLTNPLVPLPRILTPLLDDLCSPTPSPSLPSLPFPLIMPGPPRPAKGARQPSSIVRLIEFGGYHGVDEGSSRGGT
ncbi:hypothetical protein BCR35DRAFT_224369 [Leucosporidium creatinivorum]|uniref:Uncharacterized protein n=1 Tax=Leucosporidium creatinivorum TaxID=106004 RepID=A0A1Y2D6F0_9BASI|nr:hypothetical protein BCR35DRAFT_224369 [Leucosporidium creatinivorum]